MKIRTVLLMMAASALAANAEALDFDVYNPGAQGIFPVASTLVSGPSEAMLIDAQFSTRDGDELVKMIQASGKQLTTIYISAGDPDYYFGLEPLVAAFPQARVIASPAVVKHIEATRGAKLAYWGPKLGDGAPEKVVVPDVSSQTRFEIDGESLEVRELNTHQAFLWAPGDKTVLGGVVVNAGSHVWTADTQTKASREQWQQGLGKILALDPERVIPGHVVGEAPEGVTAVTFTRDYLVHFEQALDQFQDSGAVIKAMEKQYPTLPGKDSLEIGAKVSTGEMEW